MFNFSHTLLLRTFVPHKKNRVNLNSTTRHPCSLWYTCFPSTFVITWRNFNWNVSNNFHYLIDFLQPIFATQTSDLCFLCKNTGDKRSLFCCGRRQSSIWISNIILKVLIECWHVPVTGGYLPSHRNHLKYCEFLPFLQNFFWFAKMYVYEKHIFWISWKLWNTKISRISGAGAHLWYRIWVWVHKSEVPKDDLRGILKCRLVFHWRNFFSKAIYLQTYTVVVSLFLEII